MEKSQKDKNKIPTQYMLDKRKNSMIILFGIIIIITCIINYRFYKYVDLNRGNFIISILFTLILPLIGGLYSVVHHIYFQQTHTEQEALEELQEENSLKKESRIPIILFGLGVFIARLENKNISSIFPYLMYSLLFGTIIIEVMNHFIFDFNNLDKLITIEELEFSSIMLSYGFLIMGIYLTMYFFHRK